MKTSDATQINAPGQKEFSWLLGTADSTPTAIRNELLTNINETLIVACITHTTTSSIALISYTITQSAWALYWVSLEVAALTIRVPLLKRLKRTPSPVESNDFVWLNRITTLWFMILGGAALMCLLSGNIVISILVSNLVISLQGGISSRLACAPRYATFLNIMLITPTVIMAWTTTYQWTHAIAAGYILCFLAMHQLTKQNHKILYDKITAEFKNDTLLRRDPLTGLANRRELRIKIKAAQKIQLETYALLCLDLDGFKAVNDLHGHPVGDQLLIEVGQRLLGCIRQDDLACRTGGDEFIVILLNMNEENAQARAKEMIKTLSKPYDLGLGEMIVIGVSIGIALDKHLGESPESIVKQADDALYQAKRAGKGVYKLSKT